MSEQPPRGPGDAPGPGAHGPGDAGSDDVGSVAEEAAKLLGALSDWAKDQGGEWAQGVSGLADHAATTARQVHDHVDDNIANGSPECRYCPVCRTIHVVRQMSPEVRAHLTSAAASLVQAAAGVLATQVPQDGARQGVEHIDLDADDDSWDDPPGAPSTTDPETDA